MLLEAVDGSTALAIGPEVARPSEYLAAIWGTKDGTGPMFDGAEQAQFVMDLLARHWHTIATRKEPCHGPAGLEMFLLDIFHR